MRLLVYGGIGGSGGYARYCKGLFVTGNVPNDLGIYFVCTEDFYEKIRPLDNSVKVIIHPWPASGSLVKRHLWHLLIFPGIAHKIRPDIEFYPSGHSRSYMRKARVVTACHNLLLFDRRQFEKYRGTSKYRLLDTYRKNMSNSLLRSAGVIFTSDYSRKLVTGVLPGIKSSAVIPQGMSCGFYGLPERSYKIGKRIVVLYVSAISLYKNHAGVIRAVKALRESTGLNIVLRCVGPSDEVESKYFANILASERASGYVEVSGEMDHDDLLLEYKNADIFIFASSCEAFGVSLLEAMAARLPIACSNRSGLPDLLGDTGAYFDQDEPLSIKEALLRLIISEEARRISGEGAYRQSLRYTWNVSAKETFDFIRKIHERRD